MMSIFNIDTKGFDDWAGVGDGGDDDDDDDDADDDDDGGDDDGYDLNEF